MDLMKPIKWTVDKIIELSSLYKGPSELKKASASAYKAMRRYKLTDTLYPHASRERHPTFSKEKLIELMKTCGNRSDFQNKHGSAYNAARKLGLIDLVFPETNRYRLFGRGPYTAEELIAKATQYSSRGEWEQKDSGSYQVASRKGFVDKYGPPAVQGTSAAEKEVLSFLQQINPDFKTKRFANDYELDCFSESLKIGIEYNGFYWHSEENKGRKYHRNKTEYFEKLGIRVIHIWEDEWRDRKEQVKDFIRSACGANTVRIGARKCQFLEIEPRTAKAFLNDTHIQGSVPSVKLAIGCFYDNKLIGVCTFGLHHRDNTQIVLNRFACLANHTVSGFLAKASKLAYKQLGKLVSWADYSKSQAKGYKAAGWAVSRVHNPDYFYADNLGNRISKQSRKKSKVKTPEDMTELQHAKKDRLYRVWDCGKILLIYSETTID